MKIEDVLQTLLSAGVAGVFGILFVLDIIQPTKRSEALVTKLTELYDKAIADIHAQYAAVIAERDHSITELRADRDAWRDLAKGSDRRLSAAVPVVATAIGAPLPSGPSTTEGRP